MSATRQCHFSSIWCRAAELEDLIKEKDAIIRAKDILLAGCVCRVPGVMSSQPDALIMQTTPMDSEATFGTGTSVSISPTPADPVIQPEPQLSAILSPTVMLNPRTSSVQAPPANEWQQTPTLLPTVPDPAVIPASAPALNVEETGGAESSLSLEMWPLNIPPPELLHHLVETVFNSVPLASR